MRRLRAHAYANSPFYKRFHEGLFDAPLEALPVLTKGELMKNWDEVTTDRGVKLKDVLEFMGGKGSPGRFRGRYVINATGGTTGLRGIFIYDPDEWLSILASYDRMRVWANVAAGLMRVIKVAIVTTTYPWHQSAATGSTSRSWMDPFLGIDSTEPLNEIVRKLNAYKPRVLSTYAGMMKMLAQRQVEGELQISPEVVTSGAEVLTHDAKEAAMKAWGLLPFNTYAATETGMMASDCPEHKGLHIYEDRIILEFVDENNQPVEPGRYSAKVLVTVLSSRTLPLIRYVLNDSVQAANERCPCGRTFSLIEGIQGRVEDVIYLPGIAGGFVAIQPLLFDVIMENVPSEGWQVVQDGECSLKISIVNPGAGFDEAPLKKAISNRLTGQGALKPSIDFTYPSSLQRTAIGKAPLIKALPRPATILKAPQP